VHHNQSPNNTEFNNAGTSPTTIANARIEAVYRAPPHHTEFIHSPGGIWALQERYFINMHAPTEYAIFGRTIQGEAIMPAPCVKF
jgi:hypothetical protein